MKSAKVVGHINLASVIKVKNRIDREAGDGVLHAVGKLRSRGVTIDMVDKRIVMPKKISLGIKMLGYLDCLKKNKFAVLS